jgi:hypothetical protein
MSALRNRDVLDGPDRREAVMSTPARLVSRALAIPAGPEPPAELYRARLLREARTAGVRCRTDGADIIGVVADFQACRAEPRKRRLTPDAPAGLRSAGRNDRVDALLDDVLVAMVRGYEGRLEFELPPAQPGRNAAAYRRARTRSLGLSKRE